MASPTQQLRSIEEEQRQGGEQNPNNQSQEWETMARAWLSAFPEAKAVSTIEVESWIDSNRTSLPADLQSVPRKDLIDRLLAIQNFMRLPNQAGEPNQVDVPNASEPNQVDVPNASEPNQVDLPCAIESNQVDAAIHARFQRTDQWLPVYSWLESLDKDEVVKSKDISDWLTDNPEIREHLCSRHSRYHLMHYIKKCHMKILKRREKKKGLQQTEKPASPKAQKTVDTKEPASIPSNPLNKIPKDSDLYVAKRNEALQKFEILLELEKKLSPHFSRPQAIRN